MRKKVLVLGSNFGGLTTALAVKHELHGDVAENLLVALPPAGHFVFVEDVVEGHHRLKVLHLGGLRGRLGPDELGRGVVD